MTDDQLEATQRRLIDAAKKYDFPPDVVQAFLDVMDAYVNRVTLIVAGAQVHRPPRYQDETDDPTGYDAGRR